MSISYKIQNLNLQYEYFIARIKLDENKLDQNYNISLFKSNINYTIAWYNTEN